MTVAELIAKLQELSPDLEVYYRFNGLDFEKVSKVEETSLCFRIREPFKTVTIE